MSMQSMAAPAYATAPKPQSLRHIPGEEGWPFIGRTLHILADPKGEVERMSAKYGPVYRLPPMAGKPCSAGCFRAG
jgi:hypothetical protein